MRGMVSASHLRARSANAATDSVARADAVSVMTAACVNAYDVSGESYWPETVMTLPFGRSQSLRGQPSTAQIVSRVRRRLRWPLLRHAVALSRARFNLTNY